MSENVEVYLRDEKTAILNLSVPKEFAVAIDKLSKESGIPKNRIIVGLVQYALRQLVSEVEGEGEKKSE